MDLDGKLFRQFMEALVSAFPRRYELEKMLLFSMNVELDCVANAKRHEERVFYLIKWARAHDRLDELLAAALATAPHDAKLAAFAEAVAKLPPSSDGEGAPALEKSAWKLWKNGSTLRIAFLDGAPSLRERVKKVFHEWTRYANLYLKFIDSGESDIRVSFANDKSSWSMLGTNALAVSKLEPTINFGWLEENTPEEELRRVVLHEFGHVLGMIHEFQNPNAHIAWDWEKIYSYLVGPPRNWTHELVNLNMKPLDASALPGYRSFDPDSIMMFSFPAEFTKNGVALKQGNDLSESDKRFAAALYPRDGTKLDTAEPRETPPEKPTFPDRPGPRPTGPRPRPGETPADSWKMLFFAAQPFDERPLKLEKEYQRIIDSLAMSEGGRRISPVYLPRVWMKEMDQLFLAYEPLIVHFSGHGNEAGQLMFIDEHGKARPEPVDGIAKLFGILKDRIRCVVLNACYSKPQAEVICAHIDCVIGMSQAIRDADAIEFAGSFYLAIGYGRSVGTAFKLGCHQIGVDGILESMPVRDVHAISRDPLSPSQARVPVLLVREGMDPDQISLLPARMPWSLRRDNASNEGRVRTEGGRRRSPR